MKSQVYLPLLALLSVGSASAALLAYEGFDSGSYDEGSTFANNLAGQGTGSGSGFTGNWVQDPALISVSELYWSSFGGVATAANYTRADAGQASYSSLSTTAGQAAYETTSASANQVSFQRSFSTPTPAPNEFFVSTLINIDGSAGISLGFAALNDSDQRPFQFGFMQDGTLFARGRSSVSNGSGGSIGANTLALGSVFTAGTYFVVAQILNDGTANDTINLWINPDLNALGTADLTLNGGTVPGNRTNFYVANTAGWRTDGVVLDFKGDGSANGTTTVDEIRIGNTFGDVVVVVPEPSSALLSLLGLSALVLRRKR